MFQSFRNMFTGLLDTWSDVPAVHYRVPEAMGFKQFPKSVLACFVNFPEFRPWHGFHRSR